MFILQQKHKNRKLQKRREQVMKTTNKIQKTASTTALAVGFEILHDLTIFAQNLSKTTWAK